MRAKVYLLNGYKLIDGCCYTQSNTHLLVKRKVMYNKKKEPYIIIDGQRKYLVKEYLE